MSSTYRVQKYRFLKRQRKNESLSENETDNASTQNDISDYSKEGSVDYEFTFIDNHMDTMTFHRDTKLNSDEIEIHSLSDHYTGLVDNKDQSIEIYSSDSEENTDLDSINDKSMNIQLDRSDHEDIESNYVMENSYQDELLCGNIKSKIIALYHRHIGTITQKFVDDMLLVLRSENYLNLPKNCKTLFKTNVEKTDIRLMLSSDDTIGQFIYYGISSSLKYIIDPNIYCEREILILVNIDGAEIHNKSKNHVWTILGMLHNKNYYSKPFLIALYYGHSKPSSVGDYLEDFIREANNLRSDGIDIGTFHYGFKIRAFVCDTPARAFIKQCKGHTGFCCCERCEVHGTTEIVNRKMGNKKRITQKRVFKVLNCRERTCESFRKQRQPEHHSGNELSPLLDIEGFDIIKDVLLDSMHLLCLGVTDFLLDKLLKQLGDRNIAILQEYLDNITSDIPTEFQRKTFDLNDTGNWKATQYRFILLYCFGLYFKYFLSIEQYKHLMLLFAFCRILASKHLAVNHAEYAKSLLRKFVSLMPLWYGEDSVSINFHNLIHISDDVVNMNDSLFEYSAFAFEDCLGFIKKLIKSTNRPVEQITRRVYELQNGQISSVQHRYPLIYKVKKKNKVPICSEKEEYGNSLLLKEVKYLDITIKLVHPDNVLKMKDGCLIKVENLFVKDISNKVKHEVIVAGKKYLEISNVFDYPMLSTDIGISYIHKTSANIFEYSIHDVAQKCLCTQLNHKSLAITLLH